ncbi:MAG: hypothetical protein OXI02_06705 [Candidatus Dadabacteria bacterium]|nr:hypothetical protein [Candidatus Dadabacteria bacterium]MDE0477731.1 hypothetical protein [Candidatus Dadabacteria bacterium]
MRKILLVFLLFLAVPVSSYGKEEVYKTYTDIGKLEPPAVTISQVLSSRDEFDRKIFTLDGQVGELRFKKMVNGRKFTLFQFFENDPERRINVYARGFVEGIENGSKIRIWGRYSKHKRYFLSKRKNIMKAKKIQIDGVPESVQSGTEEESSS